MANAHLTIHWNEISSNRLNAMKSSAKKREIGPQSFICCGRSDTLLRDHSCTYYVSTFLGLLLTHYVSPNKYCTEHQENVHFRL